MKFNKVSILLCICICFAFVLSSCGVKNADTAIERGFVADISETAKTSTVKDDIVKDESRQITTGADVPLYDIGDSLQFGYFEQDNDSTDGREPIEWIVLDKTGDEYLLISMSALYSMPYNYERISTKWEECSLREWLNCRFFYSAFSQTESAHIIKVNTADCEDRVFVLSQSEAERYFKDAKGRITTATAYARKFGAYTENGSCGWWLRDPGDAADLAARVNIKGEIMTGDSSEGGVERQDYSVRPAIRVNFRDPVVKKLSKSDEQQAILNMSWQDFRMNYFYPAELFYHALIPFNGGNISVDYEHYYDSDGNLLDGYRDDRYYRIDDPDYPDKQALHDACCKYLSEAYVDNAEKEYAPFFEKDGQLFIKESYLFGDTPGSDLYKLFSVRSDNDDEMIVNIKCYWDAARTNLWRDADYKMIYENGNWVFDSFEQIF